MVPKIISMLLLITVLSALCSTLPVNRVRKERGVVDDQIWFPDSKRPETTTVFLDDKYIVNVKENCAEGYQMVNNVCRKQFRSS